MEVTGLLGNLLWELPKDAQQRTPLLPHRREGRIGGGAPRTGEEAPAGSPRSWAPVTRLPPGLLSGRAQHP